MTRAGRVLSSLTSDWIRTAIVPGLTWALEGVDAARLFDKLCVRRLVNRDESNAN